MKFIFIFCTILHLSRNTVLPNSLKQFQCSKLETEFDKCVTNQLKKALPSIINGSKQFNLPRLDPWYIPLITVNRTVSELIDIKAVMKDIKITGLRDVAIEDLRANPTTNFFEVRIRVPKTYVEMKYEAHGRLFIVIDSKGHSQGNISDATASIRGDLRLYKKDNVDYFTTNSLNMTITVPNIIQKKIAENPDEQINVDAIEKFIDENLHQALEVVGPIMNDVGSQLMETTINRILSIKPAHEWLS